MTMICEQLTSWVPMDGARTNNAPYAPYLTLFCKQSAEGKEKSSASFHVQIRGRSFT